MNKKFDIHTKITDAQAKEIAILANCYIITAYNLKVTRHGVDPKFISIETINRMTGSDTDSAWVKIKDNLDVYCHVKNHASDGAYTTEATTFNQHEIQNMFNKIFKIKK